MRHWNLLEIDTPDGSRDPVVLHSTDEARAVLVTLNAGQELGEHQVKERSWLVVVDGEAEISSGGARVNGGRGTVACFDPDERHVVRSDGGARILLFLSPWPGEGHYRGEERSL